MIADAIFIILIAYQAYEIYRLKKENIKLVDCCDRFVNKLKGIEQLNKVKTEIHLN